MSNNVVVGIAFGDVYRVLARHWRKSAAVFLGTIVGAALLTLVLPKTYRSEGKLFVRLGRENATLDPTATMSQTPIVTVPQSRETEINSVVEILQSRILLERIVDSLGPAVVLDREPPKPASEHSPQEASGVAVGKAVDHAASLMRWASPDNGLDDRERAVLWLAKHVKIEAARKSNVIEVSCQGPTPVLCQSIVAKLIDAYVDEHLRLNRTSGSHDFFAGQTNRLREELTRREAELRDLKTATGLASPADQRQLLVKRIGRIEDDLLKTESSRAVAEAKVSELREKLTTLPETQVTSETDGIGDEGTNRMRDQFYQLQVREKEAQAKYTEDHPKMKLVRDQVATARAVLAEEERGRKQVTKEPGRLYHQTELSLLQEEPGLASLQAQSEKLRAQLADVRKELSMLNENEMRIATLQREIDLVEADYRKYSVSLEQARIDQQLEVQRMSNIGIVQPASFEPRPVRPRTGLNMLLALGAGLFGALALPVAIEQFGGSPVLPLGVRRRFVSPVWARIPRVSVRPSADQPTGVSP